MVKKKMLILKLMKYKPYVELLWTKTKRSKINTKRKLKNGKSLPWLYLVIHSFKLIKNSFLMKVLQLQRTHYPIVIKLPHKWLEKSASTHLLIFLKNLRMTLSTKNSYNSLTSLVTIKTTKSLPDLKVCQKKKRLKLWKSSKLKHGQG